MHLKTPARVPWTVTILDEDGRLEFEQRFLLLRLSFGLTSVSLILTYGWSALFPAMHIDLAVLADCGLSWLLLARFREQILRFQLTLRLLDLLVAYVVLQDVHRFVGNTYYDSIYLFFVVAATATHGRRGTYLISAVATLAVLLGRLQLIAMGALHFQPRHISDTSFYALLFVATGLTTGFLMKKSSERLQHLALHDPLTALPNRVLLQDRLEGGLLSAERNGTSLALLVMDLDGFKEINDTFGHFYGDRVLQEVAARLKSVVRKSDTVARLGGDEFAVVLPETAASGAERVALTFQCAFREPIVLESHAFDVAASIGIALYPADGKDKATLLRHADVAMYRAKRSGSFSALYATDHDKLTGERLVLTRELRRAIETDELILHYQPQMDLQTGTVRHVEALVRWQHPERGLLMPDTFIPLAEQMGLIEPLSIWVIHAAAKQCRAWHDAGLPIAVAINLPAQTLTPRHTGIVDAIEEVLAKSGLPPWTLEVEITETGVMDNPEQAIRVLARLRDMGVRISIDDFGTGYSSLAYLQRLPVDQTKIDRAFVTDMVLKNENAFIVRAIVDLSHNLGLQTVAEGVEDNQTRRLLQAVGCDLMQGYHLSKPLRPEDLLDWLRGMEASAAS